MRKALLESALEACVRYAQARCTQTALRMMAGHIPYAWAAPVMAHPKSRFAAQRVMQRTQIADHVLLRVVTMLGVDRRAPVTTHIGCDCAEAKSAEYRQLMTPTSGEFGPTVNEKNQWPGFGSAREIVALVIAELQRVTSYRGEIAVRHLSGLVLLLALDRFSPRVWRRLVAITR